MAQQVTLNDLNNILGAINKAVESISRKVDNLNNSITQLIMNPQEQAQQSVRVSANKLTSIGSGGKNDPLTKISNNVEKILEIIDPEKKSKGKNSIVFDNSVLDFTDFVLFLSTSLEQMNMDAYNDNLIKLGDGFTVFIKKLEEIDAKRLEKISKTFKGFNETVQSLKDITEIFSVKNLIKLQLMGKLVHNIPRAINYLVDACESINQLRDGKKIKNSMKDLKEILSLVKAIETQSLIIGLMSVAATVANIGVAIYVWSLSLLSKEIGHFFDKGEYKDAKNNISDIKSIMTDLMIIELASIANGVMAVPAMVGVAFTALYLEISGETLIGIANILPKKKLDDSAKTMKALNGIMLGILGIEATTILVGALAVLAYPSLMIGSLVVLGIALLTAGVVSILKPVDKDISKSALGLLLFTGSAVLATIGMVFIGEVVKQNWDGLLLGGIAVVGLVGIMYLLSKINGDIVKGGVCMLLMSASLLLFGYALEQIASVVGGDGGWELLGKIGASVTAAVAIFAVVGIPVVAGLVALGGAVMLLMGVGMISFAVGLTVADKLLSNVDMKSLEDNLLKGIECSTTFAKEIGKSVLWAVAALPATILISTSLVLFGGTLKLIEKMKVGDAQIKPVFDKFNDVIVGINKLGAWDLAEASAKALALIPVGLALTSVAKGLGEVAKIAEGKVPIYNEKTGELEGYERVKLEDLGKSTANIMKELVGAINNIDLGTMKEYDVPGAGLFGSKARLLLPEFGAKLIYLMPIGELLANLAVGLTEISKLATMKGEMVVSDGNGGTKKVPFNFTDLSKSISTMVTTLADAISKIDLGEETEIDVPKGGLWGAITGGHDKVKLPSFAVKLKSLVPLSDFLVNLAQALTLLTKDKEGKEIDFNSVEASLKGMVSIMPSVMSVQGLGSLKMDEDDLGEYMNGLNAFGEFAKHIGAFSKLPDSSVVDKMTTSVSGFMSNTIVFSAQTFNNPVYKKSVEDYYEFIDKGIKPLTVFEPENFDKIAKINKNMLNDIKGVDIEKVKVVSKLYENIASIQNSRDNNFKKVVEAMTESLEELREVIMGNTNAVEDASSVLSRNTNDNNNPTPQYSTPSKSESKFDTSALERTLSNIENLLKRRGGEEVALTINGVDGETWTIRRN